MNDSKTKTAWSGMFEPAMIPSYNSTGWHVHNYLATIEAPILFAGTFEECEAFIGGLAYAKENGWTL